MEKVSRMQQERAVRLINNFCAKYAPHEGETLEEAAEKGTGYLVWLCEEAKTDRESLELIGAFLEECPDYDPSS